MIIIFIILLILNSFKWPTPNFKIYNSILMNFNEI